MSSWRRPAIRASRPSVKCNHVSARTMEVFRRLGLAQKVRDTGLPADYPNDASYRTTSTGIEMSRIPIPARNERYTATGGPDTMVADAGTTAPHQPDLSRTDDVRACRSDAGRSHSQPDPDRGLHAGRAGVVATARDLDSGETFTIASDISRRLRRRRVRPSAARSARNCRERR